MCPLLHDPPIRKHKNHIRILDRRQPMRNTNRRPRRPRLIQRRLHNPLRLRIQCRRRFV